MYESPVEELMVQPSLILCFRDCAAHVFCLTFSAYQFIAIEEHIGLYFESRSWLDSLFHLVGIGGRGR